MLVCYSSSLPFSIHHIHVPFNYLAFSCIFLNLPYVLLKDPEKSRVFFTRFQHTDAGASTTCWRVSSPTRVTAIVAMDFWARCCTRPRIMTFWHQTPHDQSTFTSHGHHYSHEWFIVHCEWRSVGEWWVLAICDLLRCWLRTISFCWMINHCMMQIVYCNHWRHRGNGQPNGSAFRIRYHMLWLDILGMSNWYQLFLTGDAKWLGWYNELGNGFIKAIAPKDTNELEHNKLSLIFSNRDAEIGTPLGVV